MRTVDVISLHPKRVLSFSHVLRKGLQWLLPLALLGANTSTGKRQRNTFSVAPRSTLEDCELRERLHSKKGYAAAAAAAVAAEHRGDESVDDVQTRHGDEQEESSVEAAEQ